MDANRPSVVPHEISAYVAGLVEPPDQVLDDLRRRTADLGRVAMMQVSVEEGALLTLLTRLAGASQAVEVGTFTGYSAICIARGLRAGGHLLCLDVSEEYTTIAREAWSGSDVEDRIELRLGPALDSLRSLPTTEHLDLGFIDADKLPYPAYYEELVTRLRPGGVILADNTLRAGRVADPARDDEETRAMRAFNELVAHDERVESVILPVSDGLTLARKR